MHYLYFFQVPEGRSGTYVADTIDCGSWPRPPPHRSKDSVAKITWDGLAFVVSVSLILRILQKYLFIVI